MSDGRLLPGRIAEMLSTPPAIMAGAPSATMRPAAIAIACRPEAQKRFTVVPATDSGRPARTTAWRAMLRARDAFGVAAAQDRVLDQRGVDARALDRGLARRTRPAAGPA